MSSSHMCSCMMSKWTSRRPAGDLEQPKKKGKKSCTQFNATPVSSHIMD